MATDNLLRSQESVHLLATQLEDLDRLMQLHTPGSEPESVAPIAAWQGRYGKRGRLRGALVEIFKASHPEWVTTDELMARVVSECGLSFDDTATRERWRINSFRGALKLLAKEQLIERGHPTTNTSETGMWRLKVTRPLTLADLAAQASRLAPSETAP